MKSIGGDGMNFKGLNTYGLGLPRAAVLLLVLMSPQAGAIGTFNPSEAELALLPSYCVPRAHPWGNDTSHPEVRRWRSVFGDNYSHMHHYCQGLLHLLRGNLKPLDSHQAYINYKKAVGNLEYMESRASSDFNLMPELYLKKAQALSRMDQPREAVGAFRRSIKLKPDYVPAYAALSDFHLVQGRPEQARKVLREGLNAVPDAGSLQRRLQESQSVSEAEATTDDEAAMAAENPEQTE